MKLEDMTKAELVRLIRERFFFRVTDKDLVLVRSQTLMDRSCELLDESARVIVEPVKTHLETMEKYKKADALYRLGERLYDLHRWYWQRVMAG